VLTLTLAMTLLLSGTPASGTTTSALPLRGVLTPGQSLGGVRLGDTQQSVRARWGDRYTRCTVCRRTT
jgi:hypothetical protein